MMTQDKIQIEILEDGTIKISTDKVSMPNHASAEGFLRFMAEMANGGKQDRIRKGTAHHHDHEHVHEGHGHN